MKRAIWTLSLLALVAGAAWAINVQYSSGAAGIFVTDVNTNTPFVDNHSGGTSAAFKAAGGYVCSRATSADSCHFDEIDGVATTADIRVEPGACVPFGYRGVITGETGGFSAVGTICAAGQTATFDIVAYR
jgi:hypothetical protein